MAESEYIEVQVGTKASLIDVRYTRVVRAADGTLTRYPIMAYDYSECLDKGMPVVRTHAA